MYPTRTAAFRYEKRTHLTELRRQSGDDKDHTYRRETATDYGCDRPKELGGHARLEAAELIRGAGKDAFDRGDTPPHRVGGTGQHEHVADHHAHAVQSTEDAQEEEREPENLGEPKADHDHATTGHRGKEDDPGMLQAWAVREEACHTERPKGWGRLQQPQTSRANPEDVTGKNR